MFKYIMFTLMLTICLSAQSRFDEMTIKGSQDTVMAQDASTLATTVISYEHHEVHSGSMYSVQVLNPDLDNGDTLNIAFTTPNTTKWFHMLILVDNSSESRLELHEAPTVTNGSGDTLVVYNHNRNSVKTSTMLSIDASAISARASGNVATTVAGTILYSEQIGSGRNKIAGESRAINEWILDQNATYCVMLIGLADNGSANVLLNWYEHTDKK